MTAAVRSAGGNADDWARLKGTLAFLDRSPLVLNGESAFEAGDGGDCSRMRGAFGESGQRLSPVSGFSAVGFPSAGVAIRRALAGHEGRLCAGKRA